MQETLFKLKGWELVRPEHDILEHVELYHTKCDFYFYSSVITVGRCISCQEKIPDEIVALWRLQNQE